MAAGSEAHIDHRLIMFAGSGSGAGKSTLSAYLARQLALHGMPVQWFYEEDVFGLDPIRRFAEEWYRGGSEALDLFLAAARHLAPEWAASDAVWITDSLYPGFFWLLGRYPYDRIRTFGDELARVLQPLRPLTVYLRADVPVAWRRAVAQRGVAWTEGIIPFIRSWPLPYYPGGPIEGETDVLRLLAWLDAGCRDLLNRWPGEILMLDTTDTPLTDLKAQVLRYFGLSEMISPDSHHAC